MTEKQNNPIRELQKFQERANQQPGTFLKNNECTGHLSNTKRPASPQKMTNVCDDRIISMVKTNNFTTSKEDKTQGDRCIIVSIYHGGVCMNVNIESLQQGANRQVIQGSEMGYSATGKSVN